MKKIYFLFFILCFQVGNSQYTAIPDANFEQELINQGIDANPTIDGQVLTSAINTITSLYIYSNNLHNIIGIENFTALESLDIEQCNNLTELDLSWNLNLNYLDCRNNNLNNLNISNNILLGVLHCGWNNLTTLDVSNNVNLSSIYCMNNHLTALDVSNNINLVDFYCYYNNLTNLNVDNNINLVEFHCDYNQLTTLSISNNPLLKLLTCGYNLLTSLIISNVPQFVRLGCDNNLLTSLDVSTVPTIKNLFCRNNLFTTLGLSNNLELTSLYCSNNAKLIDLNLNSNSSLNILYCSNNNNLSTLSIQNGANTLLDGTYTIYTTPPAYYDRYEVQNNPNLHCIFVDDVANANANWIGVDANSHFVVTQQECDNLGNETFAINNEIAVYPNPASEVLNINSNDAIKNIIIYNTLGEKILEKMGNLNQLNVANLANGLYLIKITTENQTVVKKIVKN